MASPHPHRKNMEKPPAIPRPNRVRTCNMFATTGKCSYRNCKFAHERSDPDPATTETPQSQPPPTPRPNLVRICNMFATTGKCSYRNCKYAHERSGPCPATPETLRSQSRPRAEGSGAGSQNFGTKRTSDPHHYRWRRFLSSGGQGGQPSPLSPDQVEQFLTNAIAVLDESNPGPKQDLLKELGTEAGVQRIRQLTEANYVTHNTAQNFLFKTHCVPFLQLLSHSELRSSLVAEKAVGTIYNVVYGNSGRRAIQFFTDIAENLRSVHAELATNGGHEFFQVALPAATSTLFNTLDMNQSATVQPEFKTIVNRFGDCLDFFPNKTDFSFRSADNDIHRLKALLQMADSLPATYIPQPDTYSKASVSVPQIILDLPGNLSVEGVRHDNDHENIAEIKILPTASEISCPRDDFLPQRSPNSTHHLDGLQRLIDSQFRLLRADTSGKIKETILDVYKRWDEFTKPENRKKAKRTNQSGLFTRTATNPALKSFSVIENQGLQIDVTFDQPDRAKKMNVIERQEFWTKYKFLQEGTLLCILDNMRRCIFFTVGRRSVEPRKKNDRDTTDSQQEGTGKNEVNDLAGNADRAMITLRFAENPTYNDIATLTDWADGSKVCLLVEFSSVLFSAFEPILQCLQTISKSIGNVPFSKWISLDTNYPYQISFRGSATPAEVDVPPPLYLSKPNMRLDLTSITKNKQPLYFSAQRPLGAEELEKCTMLDRGQCAAVIASFTRELALIQGPPGTGKSYVGDQIVKVLLANRNRTNIGPIVCVCYTNHALDQFLEHILETTDKVVRLGSKSKSEALQKLTIQAFATSTNVRTTPNEYNAIRDAQENLRNIESSIHSLCKNIFRDGQKSLVSYLEEYYPAYHTRLFGEYDEEGYKIVRSKDESKVIGDWLKGTGMIDHWRTPPQSNRGLGQILQVDDIFNLSLVEREKLKQHLETEMTTRAQHQLAYGIMEYTAARDNLSTQRASRDLRTLEDAHVIGVTTNGLAMHSHMLRSLRSKVLIVEEAAEVLEAHLLTAFLPTLEHAILIGDHLQLRPQISNYELSVESATGKNYALDESLFERLTKERYNGARFPFAKLDTQRRMYPTISSLIRNTLYPDLLDHPETYTHAGVPGMAHRLFWFDHRYLESGAGGIEEATTSHTNHFEVDFVVALVRHLTRQGVYKQNDIAVLTPYLGQLNLLRRKLNSMVEVIIADKDQEVLDQEDDGEENDIWGKQTAYSGVGQKLRKGNLGGEVKIATVDNFQGEEAKVIIISLVRSNEQRKCGFLKTSNRINVLLSRARDGMYIIGNALTSNRIKMWSDILEEMERNRNIGELLELRCPRHPDKQIFVASADDFDHRAPEGGCNENCDQRLNCGHPCKQKCHSRSLHQTVICEEPCQKGFKNCSHPCLKICGADCGLCMAKIGPLELPCGHIKRKLKCHESQDLGKVYCREKVTRLLPLCYHEGIMNCSDDISEFSCREKCGDILPCGHACANPCSSCKQKDTDEPVVDHPTCTQPCGRNYTTCKHTCRQPCHGETPCKLCEQPCEIRCNHSRCGKKCSEPCAPCPERCSWTCIHREPCQMPCAVPCDIIPCSKRCENILHCGHQCPSVCGETCPPPEICQKCAAKDKLERPVDYITFETYADINLDEDPIIYLSCGHFFTVGTLDGLMEMSDAYHIDPNTGNILRPKPLSESSKMKGCPDCRQPLLDIYRYNRVVKSSFLFESAKRFCALAHDTYLYLWQKVSDADLILENNRETFLSELNRGLRLESVKPAQQLNAIQERLRSPTPLIRRVETFIDFAAKAEQPYTKVYGMVIAAKDRRGIRNSFRLDNSAVQLSFHLKGLALYLQLKWATHWDTHKITDSAQINENLKATLRTNTAQELSHLRLRCYRLRNLSQNANSIPYEIEARTYQAKFTALQLLHTSVFSSTPRPPELQAIITSELDSLSECSQLVERHPGTAGKYREEIEKSRTLLNGGTFYNFVSDERKRAICQPVATVTSGTGHWYTCENGHLFMVGECGMPMQLATCNECGQRMRGQNHNPTDGVQSARNFERQFRTYCIPPGSSWHGDGRGSENDPRKEAT